MTAEGRMARGKENYQANKFLKNKETLDYIETIKEKPIIKIKPKEIKKNAKSSK